MLQVPSVISPEFAFWVTIYALSVTLVAGAAVFWMYMRLRRRMEITWDTFSEYLDITEFSNRNIPVRVTYKGTEPRWLWVTYLSLRNTGRVDISAKDTPERQHFVAVAPGCRYIGFNRLISTKAKVTLTPLFKGEDVYCKIDFDRLGPGDEILVSLLFVSEEKSEVSLEGELFSAGQHIVRGALRRTRSWRALWWLMIIVVLVGLIGGGIFLQSSIISQRVLMYQLQLLLLIYFAALGTAAVFLRPIRYWEQLPQRFNADTTNERTLVEFIRFIFGFTNRYPGIKP